MRIFTYILDPDKNEQDKVEVLDTSFIPKENTEIMLKHGGKIRKAIVVKTENVLEREGNNADFVFNIFIKFILDDAN